MVLPGFFTVLGTQPVLGRTFREEERQPGNHRVTILSGEYWARRFGADSSVIGNTITLNRVDYEIVGVMPPGIDLSFEAYLWLPIAFNESRWSNRGSHYLAAIARLEPGVTIDEARSELETIAARLGVAYPEEKRRMGSHGSLVARRPGRTFEARPAASPGCRIARADDRMCERREPATRPWEQTPR